MAPQHLLHLVSYHIFMFLNIYFFYPAENIFVNMGGNIIADIASSGGGREVIDISEQDNQQLQFLEVNTGQGL